MKMTMYNKSLDGEQMVLPLTMTLSRMAHVLALTKESRMEVKQSEEHVPESRPKVRRVVIMGGLNQGSVTERRLVMAGKISTRAAR